MAGVVPPPGQKGRRNAAPPPGLERSLSSMAVGRRKPHAFASVSPQKSINSKQLASNFPAVSYTNPYPRFSITRQLSLG